MAGNKSFFKLILLLFTVLIYSCEEETIAPNRDTVFAGEMISFQNPYLAEGNRFEWIFDDGTPNIVDSEPSHIFRFAGNYIVRVRVWNDNTIKGIFIVSYVNVVPVFLPSEAELKAKTFNSLTLHENKEIDLEIAFPDYYEMHNDILFSWNMGNGVERQTDLPEISDFIYQEKGIYEVSISFEDLIGNTVTIKEQLEILDDSSTLIFSFNSLPTPLANPQSGHFILYSDNIFSLQLDELYVFDYPGPLATTTPLFKDGKFVYGNSSDDINHYDYKTLVNPNLATEVEIKYPAFRDNSSLPNYFANLMYLRVGDNGFNYGTRTINIRPGLATHYEISTDTYSY